MLAQLGPLTSLQPMPGLSCKDLQPMVLPGLSRLPPLPWALTQAALVLVQQGAGCHVQATALVRQLVRALDMRTAQDLLRLMAQLNTAPARSRLLQLYRLALTGTGAACAGVAPLGRHYYMVMWRRGIELHPAPGARAWLHRCSSAPRGRWRRNTDDACSPPGEDEVHRMLEWVPGVSTLYNLGTSIYFAYEGCEEVASQRALEAAVDLGYDGLAVLSASAGGPVAYGIHLGLQPGLKAGVRGLIRYFTSDEAPPPAPTAHAGPVRVV
ncbi:APOF protein, partial [Crypturellus soui]|nr:APOF protein [Crypturellus soui]